MKILQKIGLIVFIIGITVFSISPFIGSYKVTDDILKSNLSEQQYNNLSKKLKEKLVGSSFSFAWQISSILVNEYEAKNEEFKSKQEWDKVMYDDPQEVSLSITKASASGFYINNIFLFFLISFGFGVIGAIMYFLPDVILLGSPGIKNNHIYQNSSTNRGIIAYFVFFYLIAFYILLYFYPALLTNQILLVDPLSLALNGNPASRWFLYGVLYCTVMLTMGVRMYIKYRHNKYQIVRTTSVLFFQVAFAFLIPELLIRFNQPSMDFKNAWPLNYSFFFDWNIENLLNSGAIGAFMLFWGIALTLIIVPVFSYFYGKRWYCSWVCGCGGLAETLGDPYRQHSNKTLKAWQLERWLIHGVLVFAIIMTGAALYTFFTNENTLLGIETYTIQKTYGFLIGSIFAGVIGTGFYPIFGNRVWCRFGCPLAAYMGIIQRFKSRFRITTNGGQCISCGNCSTYCEQGIDVRWYAQRGENIVRASCVGCGVCSAVCPRGVLKLENGPEQDRIIENPIIIGNDGIKLNM